MFNEIKFADSFIETPGETIGGKNQQVMTDINANHKNISIYIEDYKIDEIHAKYYFEIFRTKIQINQKKWHQCPTTK